MQGMGYSRRMPRPSVTRRSTPAVQGTAQSAPSAVRGARLPLDWLGQDPGLARLAAAATRLMTLQKEVQQVLAPLQVQVLALDQGRLTLSAHHAAAAARLRQREPSLVRHLMARGWPVTEVSFRPPRAGDQIPTPPRPIKAAPQADALARLGVLADQVRHPELAQALRRFAQRHAASLRRPPSR